MPNPAGGRLATKRGLIACYTLELLALGILIGGLIVIIAVVIPAVFNSFGMEPGGRFLTRVFDGYNRTVGAAIVILIGTAAWQIRIGAQGSGPSSVVSRSELILLTLMAGVALLISFVFGPASVTLQERAFAAQGEVARKAAYEAFFRSHAVVRGLYLLNLGFAIVLLVMKARRALEQVRASQPEAE